MKILLKSLRTSRLASDLLPAQHGNALIEVSLILPILIVMLLSVIDLGLVLRQDMIVADSARAGAEYPTNWATSSDTAGMVAAATTSAGNIPGYQATAMVLCTCGPGGAAIACNASCPAYGNPTQYAQVTATANLPLVYNMTGFPATINVKSVVRMRVPWTGGH